MSVSTGTFQGRFLLWCKIKTDDFGPDGLAVVVTDEVVVCEVAIHSKPEQGQPSAQPGQVFIRVF